MDDFLNKTFKRLRPYIIKMYHEDIIQEYINEYKEVKGVHPSDEQMNEMINIMIGRGEASNRADELIQDTIQEIKNHSKRDKSLSNIINSVGILLIINLCVHYILLYLKEININLVPDKYNLLSVPNFINSLIVAIISICLLIKNILNK